MFIVFDASLPKSAIDSSNDDFKALKSSLEESIADFGNEASKTINNQIDRLEKKINQLSSEYEDTELKITENEEQLSKSKEISGQTKLCLSADLFRFRKLFLILSDF